MEETRKNEGEESGGKGQGRGGDRMKNEIVNGVMKNVSQLLG